MWVPFSKVETLNTIFFLTSILLSSLRKMVTSSTIPTPSSRDNHLYHRPMGLGHFLHLLPFHSPSHTNDKHITLLLLCSSSLSYWHTPPGPMMMPYGLMGSEWVNASQQRPHIQRKTDWFLTFLVVRKKCEVDTQRFSAYTRAWYKEHCLKLGKPVSPSSPTKRLIQDLRTTPLACVHLDFLMEGP